MSIFIFEILQGFYTINKGQEPLGGDEVENTLSLGL